ncbi:hypothetical protein H839_16093 [Parageobacillus genomosp. 1]|uniref:DUF1508 domain-containing protein n=1 Tax=Parageobacillus genomosp. 1 TaxID=1295642 RepID=A0ABC9VAE3_9BACL|nr:hypothetical protein [Parageobacillus genomosp. 1]EZP75037.1 hypothetical protein H839_16093 [Parageobacillus genomosp. 1]
MSKESKVLQNRTSIYFTVHLNEKFFVSGYKSSEGRYIISNGLYDKPYKFAELDNAREAANAVNGKVKKHTIHYIETEEIEEVSVSE